MLPLAVVQRLAGRPGEVTTIAVIARLGARPKTVAARLETRFPGRGRGHRARAGGQDRHLEPPDPPDRLGDLAARPDHRRDRRHQHDGDVGLRAVPRDRDPARGRLAELADRSDDRERGAGDLPARARARARCSATRPRSSSSGAGSRSSSRPTSPRACSRGGSPSRSASGFSARSTPRCGPCGSRRSRRCGTSELEPAVAHVKPRSPSPARSESFVTRRIVIPYWPRSRSSSATICAPVSESSAPVGSSASSSLGRLASARAIATRWRSPPESVDGEACVRSERPTSPSSSRALASRSRRGTCRADHRDLHVLERVQRRHQVVRLEHEADGGGAVVRRDPRGARGAARPRRCCPSRGGRARRSGSGACSCRSRRLRSAGRTRPARAAARCPRGRGSVRPRSPCGRARRPPRRRRAARSCVRLDGVDQHRLALGGHHRRAELERDPDRRVRRPDAPSP